MCNNELNNKLYETILSLTNKLNECDPSSQEFKVVNDALCNMRQLYDSIVREERSEERASEELDAKEFANELKLRELSLKEDELKARKDERAERYISTAANILANGVMSGFKLACYNNWMNKGYRFEETGSYTSTTFRDVRGITKPKV